MSVEFKNTSWSKPEVPRALPVALAHRIARTRVGDPRMAVYNRIFAWLPFGDQFRCRVELDNCRRAMRGQVLASVSRCGENVAP